MLRSTRNLLSAIAGLEENLWTRALVNRSKSFTATISNFFNYPPGTFAKDGRMAKRHISGNDVVIPERERWFKSGVNIDEVDISDVHG